MNIALCFRQDNRGGKPVECYPRSFMRVLQEKGHNITTCGEGHKVEFLGELNQNSFDCVIEIENGRNSKGELLFQQSKANWTIPSAIWMIDVHGNPDTYKHVSVNYTHVFFAPYVTRNTFKDHTSAHWCPNSTDLKWFDRDMFKNVLPQYDFVFVGTKKGLARADPLVKICKQRGWSYWVGQLSSAGKHKWPFAGQRMREGLNLYNRGQRADGPNQRVLESMAVGRPLLTDVTDLDGMSQLFVEGKHFIGYKRDWTDLEEKMEWMIRNPNKCIEVAESAYSEVSKNHTIENRVNQILEVIEK